MNITSTQLTDNFLFKSNYAQLNGHEIHYIDVGNGDPILFIHGNPTSSYLWRNIIPFLQNDARCIALDLIGYGKSARPDIDYRFVTHADYVFKFIETLALKNITLVMHDWGNALGLFYGLNHLNNIKGFAFLEGGNFFKPIPSIENFYPTRLQNLFETLRNPLQGPELIKTTNPFLNGMKSGMLNFMSDTAWEYHKSFFKEPDSRKPIWMFPTQFPIDGEPKEVHEIVQNYSPILQSCQTPKIIFHAIPGSNTPVEVVEWAKNNFKNLITVNIGKGHHYLPEENPLLIGNKLAKWYKTLG